jgi:two-component system, NtrC family, sensor kinase
MLIELLRRGCADYLDKPFAPDQLIATVDMVLEKCRCERQTAIHLQDKMLKTDKMCTLTEIAPRIVHEINNPAQVIMGCAELILADAAIAPATKKMASNIYEAGKAVVRLNREILDMTKPQQSQYTGFSPEEPLEKAISFLVGAGILKDCGILRNYDEAIPQLRGDFMQLHQVFLNLAMNAFYAMQDSRSKLLSLAIRHDRQTGKIVISMEDSGCGIAEENMRRIFDSFFTTRSAQGGTGLGLAVVKHIVERHSGSIEVESRVGCGTVFTLRLPAAQD